MPEPEDVNQAGDFGRVDHQGALFVLHLVSLLQPVLIEAVKSKSVAWCIAAVAAGAPLTMLARTALKF